MKGGTIMDEKYAIKLFDEYKIRTNRVMKSKIAATQ